MSPEEGKDGEQARFNDHQQINYIKETVSIKAVYL